jgi:hypothetical protein
MNQLVQKRSLFSGLQYFLMAITLSSQVVASDRSDIKSLIGMQIELLNSKDSSFQARQLSKKQATAYFYAQPLEREKLFHHLHNFEPGLTYSIVSESVVMNGEKEICRGKSRDSIRIIELSAEAAHYKNTLSRLDVDCNEEVWEFEETVLSSDDRVYRFFEEGLSSKSDSDDEQPIIIKLSINEQESALILTYKYDGKVYGISTSYDEHLNFQWIEYLLKSEGTRRRGDNPHVVHSKVVGFEVE